MVKNFLRSDPQQKLFYTDYQWDIKFVLRWIKQNLKIADFFFHLIKGSENGTEKEGWPCVECNLFQRSKFELVFNRYFIFSFFHLTFFFLHHINYGIHNSQIEYLHIYDLIKLNSIFVQLHYTLLYIEIQNDINICVMSGKAKGEKIEFVHIWTQLKITYVN